MNHLSRNDYAGALALLARVETSVVSVGSFAHETVAAVGEIVAADLTVLCACDQVDWPRGIVGLRGGRLSGEDIARFDRRPFARRMARHHGLARTADSAQLSDLLDGRLLHRCAPYAGGGRHDSALPQGPALREGEPESLTPRERDVTHWLAAGKTDAVVAALLSLSPRTVSKHLEHIYVKLDVETRTAAVMRVLAMRAPRSPVRGEP